MDISPGNRYHLVYSKVNSTRLKVIKTPASVLFHRKGRGTDKSISFIV